MSNALQRNQQTLNQPATGSQKPKRARKATLYKMQWLAERLRKIERIKKELNEGTYDVDAEIVARSMLHLDK